MKKDDTWYLQKVGDEESIVIIRGESTEPVADSDEGLMKRDPRTGRAVFRVSGRMHFDPEPKYVPAHWRYCDNQDQIASDTEGWPVVAKSVGTDLV